MKNHESNVDNLEKLAKKNGISIIKDKLAEEMNELLVALEKNDDENILEEMADVTVLLIQYRIIDPVGSTTIDNIVEEKINRTMSKLGVE